MAELYQHYKGRFYLLHHRVLHSETLEHLIYYECLYDNDKGKFWVRPEKMFFESIEVNGKKTPRFKKVEIRYLEKEQLENDDKALLAKFFRDKKIFPEFEEKKFLYQLETKTRLHTVFAFIDDELVGVKIGYVLSPYKFYSWMGGIDPQFRKSGIGSELMNRQHQWCRKQKFLLIETRTRNQFPEMLNLNLKFGFQIVGTKLDKKGEPKILLEKKL